MAVGGSRRSAYNTGIPVRRVVCLTYVVSGMLAALAGLLFATRLSGAGADTGIGLELTALTAAVLGGNSLGGGRGSVAKALIGAVIVLLLVNGLVRLGLPSRRLAMVLGLRAAACGRDRRALAEEPAQAPAKVYVSPTCIAFPRRPRPNAARPRSMR